ncbi:MAG TPA: SDR family oxidoreductase [Aeromicrobium sp.]|nr:SDR family oxidoreductase [Aeromicrobium sp.]
MSKRCVVTGAAGGIGLAIAEALVARGDRVLLVDLAEGPLVAAATRLAQPWLSVDCAAEAGIAALLAKADAEFGGIDLYVANAGVFNGFGLAAPESDWALSWEVNVMAHVRAARALVPRWSPEQPGVFAVTASAAGLLTQLGSPVYSATKHAAVGFATWLAATYGDQGVQVCALCPMGVATPMVDQADGSDDPDVRLAHAAVAGAGEMLAAEVAAQSLLKAIDEGRFLALPHESVAQMSAFKSAAPDMWMEKMQQYRGTLQS